MQVQELQMSRKDIRSQFQQHLTQFVDTEIQLGYTFAALAITERVLGNMNHFRLAKDDATKALAVVRKFLNRIDDAETRDLAAVRCGELEQAIAEL